MVLILYFFVCSCRLFAVKAVFQDVSFVPLEDECGAPVCAGGTSNVTLSVLDVVATTGMLELVVPPQVYCAWYCTRATLCFNIIF